MTAILRSDRKDDASRLLPQKYWRGMEGHPDAAPIGPRTVRRVSIRRPTDAPTGSVNGLLETYLDQREILTRFFRVRMGAEADVEDLLQELYLKVAAHDPSHADIQAPRAYLYRLATNLLVDRWRAWQRSRARDSAWLLVMRSNGALDDADDAPSPEAVVIDRDRLDQLMRVVAKLPQRTQTIFRMHKLDGLSHAEVAEQLGVSRSAVEKHIMDALRALAEKMKP